MNAQELYEEIKLALNFFDLKSHDMDKIKVTRHGRHIVFDYEDKSAMIGIPEKSFNE